MIKLHPQAGELPEIDLSSVVFEEGYVIPTRRDLVASAYQKGFAVDREILQRWHDGESHAIAAEFVMHYYRSIGHGDSMSVQMTMPHQDDISAIVVRARDVNGFDWTSHTVWPSDGKLCIESND